MFVELGLIVSFIVMLVSLSFFVSNVRSVESITPVVVIDVALVDFGCLLCMTMRVVLDIIL